MTTIAGTDLYRGSALIDVKQTATSAAASVVWGIYNPSAARKIAIERLSLRAYLDIGGAAVATLMKYEVIKGISVSAFSAGASVTPSNKVTSLASGLVSSIRVLDTGLTVTGVVWGASFDTIEAARVLASATVPLYKGTLEIPETRLKEIELVQGEILAIRLLATAVVADVLKGRCEFSEKAV